MNLFHSLSFQDSMSFLMSQISSFHDHLLVIIVMIFSVIVYLFLSIVIYPCFSRGFKSLEMLESVWTLLPCLILASLTAPSLTTLYLTDEVSNPSLTIKVIGHQWYWSYEYEGESGGGFDSYMVPTSSLESGDLRLLEVDNSVFLPLMCETRLIITSTDVIHSWSVPSLGVKMDAIPGRLNQLYVLPFRVGSVYGQCSEICGSLHSFMPIKVDVLPL